MAETPTEAASRSKTAKGISALAVLDIGTSREAFGPVCLANRLRFAGRWAGPAMREDLAPLETVAAGRALKPPPPSQTADQGLWKRAAAAALDGRSVTGDTEKSQAATAAESGAKLVCCEW